MSIIQGENSEWPSTKIIRHNQSFEFQTDEQAFYDSLEVPTPTICRECCWQRQFAFRNDIFLYKRKCDFSGKELISHYASDCFCPVYDRAVWHSDQWDALEYGQAFDDTRLFFDQFHELQKKVPRPHKVAFGEMENSEFTNVATHLKDCYMVFSAGDSERCYYAKGMVGDTDCVDCDNILRCDQCYETTNASDSYRCFYSYDIAKCTDCYFLRTCDNCMDCFGCINLSHRQYCWFNEQLSKEEYERRLAKIQFGDTDRRTELLAQVKEFFVTQPHNYHSNISCDDCVGGFIYRSHDVKDSVLVYDSEHIRSSCHTSGRDCVRITSADHQERCYEVGLCSDWPNSMYGNKFCANIYGKSSNLEYCDYCCACDDCFGCVGLSRKQFCILNKQYGEEEYHKKMSEIKNYMRERGEYGVFFPPFCSPFGYNETYAQVFFPLHKDAATEQGFRWKDAVAGAYGAETIALQDVPTSIQDVDESICRNVLCCATCSRNYKIIPHELEFYKKHTIPIPRECFYCRHARRAAMQALTHFYHRQCMCANAEHGHNDRCMVEFETTYAPDREEIVYCEGCYQKEMI